MKWVFETSEETNSRLTNWHRWFALFPVICINVNDGSYSKVWLEKIWRIRCDYNYLDLYGRHNVKSIWFYAHGEPKPEIQIKLSSKKKNLFREIDI